MNWINKTSNILNKRQKFYFMFFIITNVATYTFLSPTKKKRRFIDRIWVFPLKDYSLSIDAMLLWLYYIVFDEINDDVDSYVIAELKKKTNVSSKRLLIFIDDYKMLTNVSGCHTASCFVNTSLKKCPIIALGPIYIILLYNYIIFLYYKNDGYCIKWWVKNIQRMILCRWL